MNVFLSLSKMLEQPATESPLFWGVVAVIVGGILLLAFRDLFLWYFRINELYDRVNDLSDKVEELSKNGVAAPAACASGATATGAADEAEIALAIALARQAAA